VEVAGQFVPNNAGILLVTMTEMLTEMINKVESMDKVEKGFKDSANYASINMKLHGEVTSPELSPTVLQGFNPGAILKIQAKVIFCASFCPDGPELSMKSNNVCASLVREIMGAIGVPYNFVDRLPGTSHAWGNLRGQLYGLLKLFGDDHVAEFAHLRQEPMEILAAMTRMVGLGGTAKDSDIFGDIGLFGPHMSCIICPNSTEQLHQALVFWRDLVVDVAPGFTKDQACSIVFKALIKVTDQKVVQEYDLPGEKLDRHENAV
jgi:hypothetical protein